VQIIDNPQKRGERMAQFTFPQPNEIFVAVKEPMHGFYWIWILVVEQATGRIIQKFSSSSIQFVTWDDDGFEEAGSNLRMDELMESKAK
jgi:hypothetical protein